MRERLLELAQRHPLLRPFAKYLDDQREWTGAKNFTLSILWLSVGMFFALNGSAAFDRGQRGLAAFFHTIALLIVVYVSVRLVPRLAAATPLKWLFYQVDYKFTREGGVYSLAAVVVGLAGLNTGNNLLFIIFSSLLSGILISGVVSRIVLTGIRLNLELPEHIFARQPVLASLTVENMKLTLPSYSLTVSAKPETNGKKKPPPAARPPQLLDAPVYFPYIPRSRHSTQPVQLTFPRRGRYAQDTFEVSSRFPFSIVQKTRQLPCAHEVVVYPPVEPTEEFYEILPLISGELESYLKGRGHDLYTIRDYQAGDGARYLDWKATAKAQALKVREFAREDERRVELVFDPFRPAGADGAWQERFERGVAFCACLAWHFHEINAQLRFRAPDIETPVCPAGEIIFDVLHHLALIEPRREADGHFLEALELDTNTFKIILTSRPRGSIPTGLWTSSYFVFMDSL